MKQSVTFVHLLSLCLCCVLFISCDDEETQKPKISFALSEVSVNEGDGVLGIEVLLDRPLKRDLQIGYSISGSARDRFIASAEDSDFEIVGQHGAVEISAGAKSGEIKIAIIDDNVYEEDETIVLQLQPTGNQVEMGDRNMITITIVSDDARISASFVNATMTVNEDDEFTGFIKLPVKLDKPAPMDLTIQYSVDGTAIESLIGEGEGIPPIYYDYHIHGKLGELTIPAGQSTGNIEILVYSDFIFEIEESIELTLTPSREVATGEIATMTVTLQQQNGTVIGLFWDVDAEIADMDLFLWEEPGESDFPLAFSLTPTRTHIESVFLPRIFTDEIDEATFGLSYNYYEGIADPLDFEVHFADFTDGVLAPLEERKIFSAQYTKNNIFPWDAKDQFPVVVHTFKIINGVYTDFSEINIPSSGSRIKTHPITPGIKKYAHLNPKPF